MTYPNGGVWVPSTDEQGRARMTNIDPMGQQFVKLQEYQEIVRQAQLISQSRYASDLAWRNTADELNSAINDLTMLATDAAEQVDALQQKIDELRVLTNYTHNNPQLCFCTRCSTVRAVHQEIRDIIDPPATVVVEGAEPVILISVDTAQDGSDDETEDETFED